MQLLVMRPGPNVVREAAREGATAATYAADAARWQSLANNEYNSQYDKTIRNKEQRNYLERLGPRRGPTADRSNPDDIRQG
jgi:hypothetical protein